MKTIINKLTILSAVVVLCTSCNDSFLDRTPTNDLNEKAYWKTVSDLEAYTNGIYNEAASNTGSYKFMLAFTNDPYSGKTLSIIPREAMSDNFASIDAGQSWASNVGAGLENIATGTGTSYAAWSWTLLRRINVFLENYEKVNADDGVKKQYAGEALFFRAWFYLDMIQNYGDVPLITKSLDINSDELYGARTPRKEVMAQVLKDINNACTYLPKEWAASKQNRVTKGTALALKSRICLYEGTYRKYHKLGDETEFLTECVNASEEAMKLGYSIYDTGNPKSDYTTLFTTEDLASNKEVLFYRKYASDLLQHRICGYILNLRNGGTKDFVDDFLCKENDGTAKPVALSKSFNDDTPENNFVNRDPRLAQTFLEPGKDASTRIFQDAALGGKIFPRLGDMANSPSITGYHLIKYYIREQDKKGFGKETHDYPLFRYAEVLLNLAEAKAELNTLIQADLDRTINVLRDRVDMPHLELNPPMDPKYSDLGISSLLVEIRRERRVELSFELLRYQDLMRWAQGAKLAERVLGIRLEDSDFADPRYEGKVKKAGEEGVTNPVYTYEVNGKHYIDVYANTNWRAERRTFNPEKDYLRPIPKGVLNKNKALVQNPKWD